MDIAAKINQIDVEYNKYKKKYGHKPVCDVCQKEISHADFFWTEVVRTKRGREFFIHRDCM